MRRFLQCLALAVAACLVIDPASAKPKPIMVYTGKLTPIMPRLPTPPPPVPYPPIPPAPVWEDPEPGFTTNNLLTLPLRPLRPALKYGFRVKPYKAYYPTATYNKEYFYSYV